MKKILTLAFCTKMLTSAAHAQENTEFNIGILGGENAGADGLGNCEDAYTNGAFSKAADASLVNMSDLVQIWQSALIPEGPMVVRSALPQDVKDAVIQLTADLHETDAECAYGVAGGEAKDLVPVTVDVYEGVLATRR